MDRNRRGRKLNPRVLRRLRYYELESLAEKGKTKCDSCKNVVQKSEAIESWKGNSCIYVACLNCLTKDPVTLSIYPDGIHIDRQFGESSGVIMGSDVFLPSKKGPGYTGEEE